MNVTLQTNFEPAVQSEADIPNFAQISDTVTGTYPAYTNQGGDVCGVSGGDEFDRLGKWMPRPENEGFANLPDDQSIDTGVLGPYSLLPTGYPRQD